MRLRTDKQFGAENLHKLKNPPRAFLENPYALKLEGFEYIPEGPQFSYRDNLLYMNIYRDNGLKPMEGDYSVILEHFEYMFPNEDVRAHWLNWFACLVQFPSSKIKHCLLLISKEQGVGKSFFKELLERMFGSWNVAFIDSGSWMANFNSHHLNKRIGVIEELAIRKDVSAYNALKQYVTEPLINAKEKNVTEYKARTPYGMLAFSNDPKPIVIEETDRRLHVYETPVTPREDDYYDRLFNISDAEIAAFKYSLLRRDLTGFSPNARPPMTDDKRRLAKQSYSPAKAALEMAINLGAPPLQNDVVTLQMVQNAIRGESGISERQLEFRNLRETLRDLGALPLGQQSIEGTKHSLWAVRNAANWKDASPASIKQEFCKK